MSQYGQNELVNNPRYQGQSAGIEGRGPEGESRYGAMPMSTGTGMAGVGAQQPGYGERQGFGTSNVQSQNTGSAWPAPAAPPNAHRSDLVGQEYGAPREGMVDRAKDAVGVGPNSGYDNNRVNESGYGNQGYGNQGYGNQGYGQPREGIVDKAKDAVGMGPNSGYNNNRMNEPGYGTQAGYGQPREGVMDKAKDAVGMGPNSGYNNNRMNEPGYGTQAGYGQPREGLMDKAKDAVGVGPNSGYNNNRMNEPGYGTQAGYGQDAVGMGPNSGYGNNRMNEPGYGTDAGYGQPRREGMMQRTEDAVGMGPNSGRPYNASQEYNPNVNRPGEERGFGGGLGNTGYDESRNLGSGYDNRMTTGADAYGQPRREGVVDGAKDDVGMGPNSGYDDRTPTGRDAYVTGNNPAGMQDRITGVNEPTVLGAAQGARGVGNRDGVLGVGEHVPENVLGERRTEPGYDASKGAVSEGYDESRGKEFEDTSGGYGSKTGTGVNDYGETGTGTGYDDTPTGTGYDDTHTGTESAPPKKGILTKIKEKLHHSS